MEMCRKEKTVQYTVLSAVTKDLEKKLNSLAQQGWKVVSQSESTWVINKCFGLSRHVDSIINVILVKE